MENTPPTGLNLPPAGLNLPPLPKSIPGYPQLNPVSVYAPFEHPPAEENDSPWQQFVSLVTSRKVTDVMIAFILIVLLVPSSMAVASWNAVPGDFTYAWKISLEKGLLLVLKPSKELSSSTQVAITQRRFSEATRLLSGGKAEVGLANLTDQVTTTSDSIKDVTSKTAKKQLADKYIADLIEVNKQLEKEKLARQERRIAQANTGSTTNNFSPTSNNTVPANNNSAPPAVIQPTTAGQNTIPAIVQPTAVVVVPPVDEEVTDDIDEAQQIIEDTIEDLEELSNQGDLLPEPTPEPTAEPTPEPTPEPTSPPTTIQSIQESAPSNAPINQIDNNGNNNEHNDKKDKDDKELVGD